MRIDTSIYEGPKAEDRENVRGCMSETNPVFKGTALLVIGPYAAS